ncbi:hypothetical protein CKA32_003855 [Geitlerinema sp. FC II]|nr:hypothetical protein CKA32_003855 [Geitlerinema sp. FC II]
MWSKQWQFFGYAKLRENAIAFPKWLFRSEISILNRYP